MAKCALDGLQSHLPACHENSHKGTGTCHETQLALHRKQRGDAGNGSGTECNVCHENTGLAACPTGPCANCHETGALIHG